MGAVAGAGFWGERAEKGENGGLDKSRVGDSAWGCYWGVGDDVKARAIDVGVDCHDFYPVSWEKVKGVIHRTIKGYLSHLRHFFYDHPNQQLKDVTNDSIRAYVVKRTKEGNYAESTQNQLLNAIKFWLEQVEGRDKAFYELRPKKKKQLPHVLSVEEIGRLFRAVDNLKHRCILKTIYSAGLRLSEVTHLRTSDIRSDRMQIFIHSGKGKRDRYTTLSQKLLEELRTYFVEYRPTHWLFEGQTGGQYIVEPPRTCDFCLALFPSRGVRKPRRRKGVAYVFCLASRKNTIVIISQFLGSSTIVRGVCKRYSVKQWTKAGSIHWLRCTRCGIATLRTCWSKEVRCGTFRNCWGMRIVARRKSIHT